MGTLALTVWNDAISPLFDSAVTLAFYNKEIPDFHDCSKKTLLEKINLLRSLNAPVLVCGAISSFSLGLLSKHGVTVVPWIRGPVTDVVSAYRNGTLFGLRCFQMPGCGFHGHGRRFGNGNGSDCRRHSPPKGGRL